MFFKIALVEVQLHTVKMYCSIDFDLLIVVLIDKRIRMGFNQYAGSFDLSR